MLKIGPVVTPFHANAKSGGPSADRSRACAVVIQPSAIEAGSARLARAMTSGFSAIFGAPLSRIAAILGCAALASSSLALAQEPVGRVTRAELACQIFGDCPKLPEAAVTAPAPSIAVADCPEIADTGNGCVPEGGVLGRKTPTVSPGLRSPWPAPRPPQIRPPTEPVMANSSVCKASIRTTDGPGRANVCVNFANGRAEILEQGRANLDQLAQLLVTMPSASYLRPGQVAMVSIDGHANRTGSRDINCALSSARAQAAIDYLMSRPGVADAAHIRFSGAVGRCDDIPIAGLNPVDWQNRRIEVRVTTAPQ